MSAWLVALMVIAQAPLPEEAPGRADALKLAQWEGLVGAGTAVVVAPATILLARGIGSIPSNRYAALVPSMLLMAIVPPLVTVLVSQHVGDSLSPGTEKLWPALLAATAVQIGVLAAAIALGASARDPGDLTLFALSDAALLSGASTAMFALTRDDPAPPDVAQMPPPPTAGITIHF